MFIFMADSTKIRETQNVMRLEQTALITGRTVPHGVCAKFRSHDCLTRNEDSSDESTFLKSTLVMKTCSPERRPGAGFCPVP